MEHWEELRPGGYRLVWDDALFRPGTDSFLLAAFPALRRGMRVCDLGSGTGILGLLLLQRQGELSVTGIELQERAARLAARCAGENGLEERLRTLCMDLREVSRVLPPGSFDLVVCNPPYYPPGSGKVSENASRRMARSEESCTLEEIVRAAAYLLRDGGRVCLVHKPERLTDVLTALREARCEPKRLRLVCDRAERAPSLLLAEGRKGGGAGLTVEPPFVLRREDGTPTAAYEAAYFRREETE